MRIKEKISLFDYLIVLFFLFMMVITIYPFLNVLAVSFNDPTDTIRNVNFIIPRKFTLYNYKYVFREENLLSPMIMSVARTLIGTVTSLICTAMLAYALSRRDFYFRRVFTTFFVITMYVSGGLIPSYLLISRTLQLNDNFLVYILPGLISVYNVILVRSFIDGLPKALEEAARVDGANDIVIWARVVIPLCKPVLATVALFKYRSPKVKEYFRWLSRMYDEGILDSEFATQTHQDYIAKLATGRVIAITDNSWDYAEAETLLKADGKVDMTYAGLPVTLDEDTKAASLMYQGLTTGWGISISVDCEDPVAAIKFIDYMCSDEGMVFRHWGIEGENYFLDENGIRYRTDEEVNYASTDQYYPKKTGVGFHVTGFPIYGDGVLDSTGSTYTANSEESIIATYTTAEKKAADAMGMRMLTEMFPQPDEFETPAYSSPATYAMPMEFTEIFNILEEIAWPGLVKAVQGGQANFDTNYDAMLDAFIANDVEEAEAIMTEKVLESAAWKDR